MPVLALRGAITLDADTPEEIEEKTIRLLTTIYERNDLSHDDIISIFFTATPDIHSAPPAASARQFGLADVPLLCGQEMVVDGSLGMCIRLMLHLETERPRSQLRHVFLRGAVALRPELAETGDDR